MVRYRLHLAQLGAGLALSLPLAAGACDGETDGMDVGGEVEPAPDDTELSGGSVGEGRGAIVGGALEPGRSAVVALVHYDAAALEDILVCSGVLITPTIVVTAAHCMHPHATGYQPEELKVVFGGDIRTGEQVGVLSGAYSPQWRMDDPGGESDIGALRLASSAPVDPIAIGPAPTPGGRVVLVGYGIAAPDSTDVLDAAGVKRSGAALIGDVADTWFRVQRAPSTTCAGDSGGATLADVNGAEVLLGIHSRGDCVSELWNERIDTHANGFLKGFMAEYGGCNADGACAMGCIAPDPDCPCAADGICGESCEPGADPDCDDETCENLPPDGSTVACCDDGACDDLSPGSGGDWGSAGCSVGPSRASHGSDALFVFGLAALSFAFRRRSARGGSNRSGSSRPL